MLGPGEVLMHSVEIDNVCALLRHSDQYMAAELKRYCLAFILKNFDQAGSYAHEIYHHII